MGLSELERKAMRSAIYDEAGMSVVEGQSKGRYMASQTGKGVAEYGLPAALTGATLGAKMGMAAGGVTGPVGALMGAGAGLVAGGVVGGFKGLIGSGKEYDQAKKMMRAQVKETRRQETDARAYGKRAQMKRAEEIERSYLAASSPQEIDMNAGAGFSGYDAFKVNRYGG